MGRVYVPEGLNRRETDFTPYFQSVNFDRQILNTVRKELPECLSFANLWAYVVYLGIKT